MGVGQERGRALHARGRAGADGEGGLIRELCRQGTV